MLALCMQDMYHLGYHKVTPQITGVLYVKLIYLNSWGEGEENLAVFVSCEIYECTYLCDILKLSSLITFCAPEELTFYSGRCEKTTHRPRGWGMTR